MIEYIKGDLFDTDCKYIVHGCNAHGVMGSGVAKIIREKYPQAFTEYVRFLEPFMTPEGALGNLCVSYQPDGKAIINAITQLGYGKNGKYVSYDAVWDCFSTVRFFMEECNLTEFAMPKIGAGLGGGRWSIIEAIILEVFKGSEITVKVYEL